MLFTILNEPINISSNDVRIFKYYKPKVVFVVKTSGTDRELRKNKMSFANDVDPSMKPKC